MIKGVLQITVCLDDEQNGSPLIWSDLPSRFGKHASFLPSKMSCKYCGVVASMGTSRVPVMAAFDEQSWLALPPT